MHDEDAQLDVTKLKYVLYVRKSTDDLQKQVRSMEDQIAECEDLAERLHLKVIRPPILERKSAKTPNKRPLFTQMLKDIRAGKYNAILAWHPDRLARNMKEGGEIIDMVDAELLKDLKFVTHHFTPDANGKMLLGMSFVLSKQYSDDLSQKVTRGVRRGFKEGKSGGQPKYGYTRDEDGLYRPDANHEVVVNAWQKRKEGASQEDIAKYMNDSGYQRTIKHKGAKSTGKVVKMGTRMVGKMLHDPFYFGLLVQAKQTVDLREIYDFVPAVSEEDYNHVQQLSNRRFAPSKRKRATFYPLRGMVHCAHCNGIMYPAPSTGHKRYLYYRCDNKACTRKKRSIRSIIIFEYLYKLLAEGLNFSPKEYADYLGQMKTVSESRRIEIQTKIRSKQGAIKANGHELRDRSLRIVSYDQTSPVWKINNDKIEELTETNEGLEGEVSELKAMLVSPENEALSLEQFLNLSNNASAKLKAADAIEKDRICRRMFLNFVVDEEKVASYSLKEPYATLLKAKQIHIGGRERT